VGRSLWHLFTAVAKLALALTLPTLTLVPQFRLLELNEFGNKANVGGNPMPPLCDVGIGCLERPGIGVDQVGKDDRY
jgi:hypothetical protein